jgi:integrase
MKPLRIERGIQQIGWETKTEGTVVKFRVRIKTKTFEGTKVFDTLKEAREYLGLARSRDGQKALTEFSDKARLAEEAMNALLLSPTLDAYLLQYYVQYLKDETTPTKARSSTAYKSRINTICKTKITVNKRELSGHVAMLKQFAKGNEKRIFGSLKPEEITEQTATDYIVERCKTAAKTTVKREVSMLQAFYNKLRFLDNATWKRVGRNPFKEADKSLLKNADKKRKRRLEEVEEIALFKALSECKNPEMGQIVGLAITTGMRRGEILGLRWENINGRQATVLDGKTGDREVVLSDEALKIIETIERKDGQLFHYTADGFATNWGRIKERVGIVDFRFHDTRREFIGRIVEQISNL